MEQYKNRAEIPEKYKWNLGDIFPTEQDWEDAFNKMQQVLPQVVQYKGKLNTKEVILDYFKKSDDLEIEIGKLYCYAMMSYNEDAQDASKQGRFARIYGLLTQFSAMSAFVKPELSELSEEQLKGLIEDADFSDYDVTLKSILRNKAHVLSEAEEKIYADAGGLTHYFSEVFNRLDSGDIQFGTINVDGKEVALSHGTYSQLLQHKDQSVRRDAFKTYYKGFIDKINTISGLYEGSVKSDWFYAKGHKFNSSMERALFYEDVDKAVYDNLINAIHSTFKPLHEYMQLRKDVMGVEELNMYDLYVPIFENADISCEYEEAVEIVKEGLKPLGQDYREIMDTAFSSRWIDVCETPTKRTGAYSMGVHGVHPYMLLNYQKTTHDIFTIAHEMGHSIHTYYSEKKQPIAKAGYKIFVAEVASTCNEVLLLNHLLAKEKDVNVKKFLLSYYLDMLRTTMYRQAMFAEFEAIAHDLVEKGVPLTANKLNEEYYKLNQMYYGPAVTHTDEIKYEWARIPHFYRAFYVYKYSTGIISAVCLAQKILKEGDSAVKKYKEFLSLGGSMDPVSELKVAGVDLTTKEPFEIVAKSFEETLQQLKDLCK